MRSGGIWRPGHLARPEELLDLEPGWNPTRRRKRQPRRATTPPPRHDRGHGRRRTTPSTAQQPAHSKHSSRPWRAAASTALHVTTGRLIAMTRCAASAAAAQGTESASIENVLKPGPLLPRHLLRHLPHHLRHRRPLPLGWPSATPTLGQMRIWSSCWNHSTSRATPRTRQIVHLCPGP
jgi:hypothetical protein